MIINPSNEYDRTVVMIREYDALVEKAIEILRILFNTYVDSSEFVKLRITETNHIEVSWPEVQGGYYDSYSIETQTTRIEPTVFVMSLEALKAHVEKEEETERQKNAEERKKQNDLQTIMTKNNELAELARLKAKYGDTDG